MFGAFETVAAWATEFSQHQYHSLTLFYKLAYSQNELADVVIRADYAYDKAGYDPKVLPGDTVRYEIQLVR